jgi:lipopolysaccharide/colanic/teichoic acid biosynthesis glycosyltransferase
VFDVVGAIAGWRCWHHPRLGRPGVAVVQGRPILFRQERPGLHGKPFSLVKFRTMRSPRPGEVWYDSDAQRVTWIGRILRSTSIDELPELWNILCGEMSLVGPRPLLVEYLDHYTPEERRRHDMRPGDRLAAVNGRLPVQTACGSTRYVEHWSLALIRIISMTAV